MTHFTTRGNAEPTPFSAALTTAGGQCSISSLIFARLNRVHHSTFAFVENGATSRGIFKVRMFLGTQSRGYIFLTFSQIFSLEVRSQVGEALGSSVRSFVEQSRVFITVRRRGRMRKFPGIPPIIRRCLPRRAPASVGTRSVFSDPPVVRGIDQGFPHLRIPAARCMQMQVALYRPGLL